MISQDDYLLSVSDVAEICGMSKNALAVALHRNRFPVKPFKVGARLRWRAGDVRSWIAREAEAANADGAGAPARG